MNPQDLEAQEKECTAALRRHLSAIDKQMSRVKKVRWMARCIQEALQDYQDKTKMMVKKIEARREQAIADRIAKRDLQNAIDHFMVTTMPRMPPRVRPEMLKCLNALQASLPQVASSAMQTRGQASNPIGGTSGADGGKGVGKGVNEDVNDEECDAAPPSKRRRGNAD